MMQQNEIGLSDMRTRHGHVSYGGIQRACKRFRLLKDVESVAMLHCIMQRHVQRSMQPTSWPG